jgi:transposase-like protein
VQSCRCYPFRAIDSTGTTIDFFLSALRNAAAPNECSARLWPIQLIPSPTIAAVKQRGMGRRRSRHRPVQHLYNVLKQHHQAITRWIRANQALGEFSAARRTMQD